jgi:mono/diheme cytochrome c family protein
MAVIVAILAFMMSTGSWTTDRSILSATLNPLYLPQLAFRTFFALATAGLYAWFLIAVFLRKDDPFRPSAVRFAAAWTLAFAPLCMLAAAWYWGRVPELFAANVNVGLLTQRFAEWHSLFLKLSGGVVLSLVAIATVGLVRPTYVPRTGLMIAFLLAVGLLAHFERAREFIRKPFVIADYMYSNGVRVDQLALFQEEGILTHSTYGNPGPITDDNRVLAGRQVFLLACTRCHTTSGMNGVISKFEKLYGADPWNPTQVSTFIANMHLTRTYMPPFPGNQDELQALTAYLCQLQASPASLPGAQSDGVGDIARAGSREVERPLSSLALSTGEAAAEDGARK